MSLTTALAERLFLYRTGSKTKATIKSGTRI